MSRLKAVLAFFEPNILVSRKCSEQVNKSLNKKVGQGVELARVL